MSKGTITITTLLLLSGGTALAQVVPQAQEGGLYSTLSQDRMKLRSATDPFKPAVGAEIPQAVQLLDVPDSAEPPAVRKLKYVMFNDQVLLVDPGTRKVVQIVAKR